jgi:hypothetical protein
MSIYTFTTPILPGKTESWISYIEELKTARWDEFEKALRMIRVRAAQVRLQKTPIGDFSIVWIDANEPYRFFNLIFESNEPVIKWFREKVLRECEGLKPGTLTPNQNDLILEFIAQPAKNRAPEKSREQEVG